MDGKYSVSLGMEGQNGQKYVVGSEVRYWADLYLLEMI